MIYSKLYALVLSLVHSSYFREFFVSWNFLE